ncbi:MAG: S8 family peptidase [Verrucomicrobia bacterium]|nr:S8 family peptidase [Verrucomicrobiota bacterium]
MNTRSTRKRSARSLEMPAAKTLIYVHGLANKPEEHVLKRQWDRALFGFDLGERSRMAYWVNRNRYGAPLGDTEDPDELAAMEPRAGFAAASVRRRGDSSGDLLPPEARGRSAESLRRLERELLNNVGAATPKGNFGKKILPAPKFVRDWITRGATRALLGDAYDLFFDPVERERMEESLKSRLRTGGGPFVIIAHSQGSMIAYDVLCRWDRTKDGDIEVPLFITIGSPLGLTEVKDRMKELTGQKRLSVPASARRWANFADTCDYVALDKKLAGDYVPKDRIEDAKVDNPVRKNPHSGIGYLGTEAVRSAVMGAVHKSLFQKVSGFTVTRDLSWAMDRESEKRHPVLIELQDREPFEEDWLLRDGGKPAGKVNFKAENPGKRVRDWILERVRQDLAAHEQIPPGIKDVEKAIAEHIDLEVLQSYVSAKLTRSEVEELASQMRGVAVYRVFKNNVKRRHLKNSVETIQASTAHLGYKAKGGGVCWAVLDTEVDAQHPHFNRKGEPPTVERLFNCTRNGAVEPIKIKDNKDVDGHGTHVAGIIAGANPALGISGIAPDARIRSYKVLGDNGDGSDAKIIKALDHIYDSNRSASELQVHGVNLSLGGGFDPEAFGCGDTPLCKELRKLWRQGVVVVISAGNEGQYDIPSVGSLNTYISIGDPANLDESIVVGSVHCTKPHLYGVSYFSSRGPTADGRSKPDVVAPGEKILSCRARDPRTTAPYGKTENELYTYLSGTSMAAPHVSGLIACFLSARREFIGYPDRVKRILTQCCTDLERDVRSQGAGLVNLVKMLIST